MLTMQAFYTQLFSAQQVQDSYWLSLARLARVTLDQVAVLKSDLTWDTWDKNRETT